MSNPKGTVLVDRQLTKMAADGQIKLGKHLDRIQPASIDVVLKAGKICEVSGIPNLSHDFSYDTFIDRYAINCFKFDEEGVTLGCNRVYVAEIDMSLALMSPAFGHFSPKSSIGQIDVHCTVLAEGAREFNSVPEGYVGKLYMLIVPQSFPIRLRPSDSLCQLRLFSGQRMPIDGVGALKKLNDEVNFIHGGRPAFKPEGVVIHLDLSCSPSNLVANRTGHPIDLSARRALNPKGFFREKPMDDHGNLFLEPGEFVLASTIERLSIPDYLCGEMVAFDERWGEIRTHYAGFFDPGFGWSRDGSVHGSSPVCEIRNIGTAPLILSHHQPICLMQFEYVSELPDQVYGQTKAVEATNYQARQNLRVSKYFKAWEAYTANASTKLEEALLMARLDFPRETDQKHPQSDRGKVFGANQGRGFGRAK